MPTKMAPAHSPCSAQAIIDWIFTEGRLIESTGQFVYRLAHCMNDHGAGIELDEGRAAGAP